MGMAHCDCDDQNKLFEPDFELLSVGVTVALDSLEGGVQACSPSQAVVSTWNV